MLKSFTFVMGIDAVVLCCCSADITTFCHVSIQEICIIWIVAYTCRNGMEWYTIGFTIYLNPKLINMTLSQSDCFTCSCWTSWLDDCIWADKNKMTTVFCYDFSLSSFSLDMIGSLMQIRQASGVWNTSFSGQSYFGSIPTFSSSVTVRIFWVLVWANPSDIPGRKYSFIISLISVPHKTEMRSFSRLFSKKCRFNIFFTWTLWKCAFSISMSSAFEGFLVQNKYVSFPEWI